MTRIEKKRYRHLLVDWCRNEGEFGKLLLNEWTGIDENGMPVLLEKTSKGSHIRMEWKCQTCGNIWVTDIHNRTGYHTKCPECDLKTRSRRTLAATTHTGENDLLTWCDGHYEYGKYLKTEWLGLFENGEHIDIDKIARGSNKKVLWECSFCHEVFPCSPYLRTGKNKQGCPNCNTSNTSYPEQFIYYALKKVFPDAVSRGKFMGYEYDIILPSVMTYIEYSPTFTHSEKQERDDAKKLLCQKKGRRFIGIIEDSNNNRKHYVSDSEICFFLDYRKKIDSLIELMKDVFVELHVDPGAIDYNEVDEFAYMHSHGRIQYNDSVEYIYPDIVKEWNKSLNRRRKPSQITPYACESIYWTCIKCHYGEKGEWKALLSNRTNLKQGCPVCGYNWYDGKMHSNAQSITLKGFNDFPSCYPELYKEWNFEKNGELDPFSLRGNSHKFVFWLCQKCGYGEIDDWKRPVYSRISEKTGCPACGYNYSDGQYHITSGTSSVLSGITDLKSLYPKLSEEWDEERNKPFAPNKMKPKSRRKVYWNCLSCGYGNQGEWQVRIGDRVTSRSGCPVCGYNWYDGRMHKNGLRLVVKGVNDIASTIHKDILLEWHSELNNIDPSELRVNSHEWIYWECTKCHYGKDGKWYNTINSRTKQKSGCPVCGYNYFDGKYHKTTGRSIVLKGYNDLEKTHPEIAKEWHPSLNGDLSPDKVKAGSHTEVYWMCPACGYGSNGEWKQDIHIRVKQKPLCKKCRIRSKT